MIKSDSFYFRCLSLSCCHATIFLLPRRPSPPEPVFPDPRTHQAVIYSLTSHFTLQVKACIYLLQDRMFPAPTQPITTSADTPPFLQLATQLGQRIRPSFFQRTFQSIFIRLVRLVRTIIASQRPSRVHASLTQFLGHGMDPSLRLGRRAEHVIESAPVPGLQRYVALELERCWDLVCSY
jgi:hypothetical protein